MRLRVALGPKNIIEAMTRLATVATTHPCVATQVAGLKAPECGQPWIEEQRVCYRHKRGLAVAALEQLPGVSVERPEAGLFPFSLGRRFLERRRFARRCRPGCGPA